MSRADLLVRPAIARLPAYNSGESPEQLRRALGIERVTKLDSNENSLGASPAAHDAAREAALSLHRYPDRDETRLRSILADDLKVPSGRLVFSGGSEDVLAIIYRMVLRAGDEVVSLSPGFGLHAICAQACEAEVTLLRHRADWSFPVDEMTEALARRPRILAFASPSNPVGTMLGMAEIERLLEAATEHTLLVFDEAYIEFAGDEWRHALLRRLASYGGPWVLLRTFAKAYGLAGARIGYGAVWDEDFAVHFNKTRSPFNVNAIALAAAEAAYQDQAHMHRCVQTLIENRERLSARLTQLGFAHAPSCANFLFVDSGFDAQRFTGAMRQQGVLVKPWLEPGYTTCFRATAGQADECEALVAAMQHARDALLAEQVEPNNSYKDEEARC